LNRRGFLKTTLAAGAVLPVSAAVYFGYGAMEGKPVKAALIGAGDEGGVLLGEHNPAYIEFIACCDIRPSNKKRIIEGDPKVPLRKGFVLKYGREQADKIASSHMYDDYKEMLDKEKEIEAVVIALPLHLHAPVAIECMKRGKHVLCEKLMARTITACKDMIKTARETGKILSIGHQRHYSMLYAHALDIIKSGTLGDVKHIRALWHRNFTWDADVPKDPPPGSTLPKFRDGWFPPPTKDDYEALKDSFSKYDYKSFEELIRWRLYNRTGGGLMAELGSHQLDACSIFLGKVKPLAVTGVGTHSFFGILGKNQNRNDRSIDDHVFTMFEFPGKNHPKGANKGTDEHDVVVVTYSSISTNGLEPYGETVMGSRGTMLVEGEKDVYVYKEPQPGGGAGGKGTAVSIAKAGDGKPVMAAASTWGGPAAAAVSSSVSGSDGPPVSRGYKEEMEDFAVCIRKWDGKIGYNQKDGKFEQRLPRCHGEVAMADAILALTANLSMGKRQRIEFDPAWFDYTKSDVPDKDVNLEG
jgi:predicted dehydrogenase